MRDARVILGGVLKGVLDHSASIPNTNAFLKWL